MNFGPGQVDVYMLQSGGLAYLVHAIRVCSATDEKLFDRIGNEAFRHPPLLFRIAA